MTPGRIRELNRLASLRSQLASVGKGRTSEDIKARLRSAVDAQEKLMAMLGDSDKPKTETETETTVKVKAPSKGSAKKS